MDKGDSWLKSLEKAAFLWVFGWLAIAGWTTLQEIDLRFALSMAAISAVIWLGCFGVGELLGQWISRSKSS